MKKISFKQFLEQRRVAARLSAPPESSSSTVDADSYIDYPAFDQYEADVLVAWEQNGNYYIAFALNEVAFNGRQIKQLI